MISKLYDKVRLQSLRIQTTILRFYYLEEYHASPERENLKPERFYLNSSNRKTYLQDEDIYQGFGHLSRKALLDWKDRVVQYRQNGTLQAASDRMNVDLQSNNLIVFFDHHYAFDAIPIGLALIQQIEFATGVIVPYSVHLEMGVGRKGQPSLRYFLRTTAFRWFVGNIKNSNPGINFFPVVRDFETETPRISKIVDQRYSGVNTTYLRSFIRQFSTHQAGKICFMTPFSGIGFPGKPLLHPQLYRSVDLVQQKCGRRFPVYLLGAYPSWDAYSNYLAPLFNEHLIVMRGPFYLPQKDYQSAYDLMSKEIDKLREEGNFAPPDYNRILKK